MLVDRLLDDVMDRTHNPAGIFFTLWCMDGCSGMGIWQYMLQEMDNKLPGELGIRSSSTSDFK